LSIDGFTACTDTRASYGAFTIQSGFTGREGNKPDSQEMLGINTLRTNLIINFEGFHFPDAGPRTPIIGMDYFVRQSESSQYSIPKYVDFVNSCLHFEQPAPQHVREMGLARVPTFSTVGVTPCHDVLLSTVMDIRLPPNGEAIVRLKGHCGKLTTGSCIVQPHPGLLQLESHGQGSRRYMGSRYMMDPNLFLFSQAPLDHEHDADSHLKWLHSIVNKDMGLIVVFGGQDELHDYTEIDDAERGESDKAYHVKIVNTSPVEMLLLAGQPLATAVPAEYKDDNRDIDYMIRMETGCKGPLLQRMRSAILRSYADVNQII